MKHEVRPGVWEERNGNILHRAFDTRIIIKARRKELRMTMQQLADLAGIDRSTVSRIESGSTEKIDAEKLYRIAEALQCSPLYLTAEIDTPFPLDTDDAFVDRLYAAYMAADDKTKTIVRTLLDL